MLTLAEPQNWQIVNLIFCRLFEHTDVNTEVYQLVVKMFRKIQGARLLAQ